MGNTPPKEPSDSWLQYLPDYLEAYLYSNQIQSDCIRALTGAIVKTETDPLTIVDIPEEDLIRIMERFKNEVPLIHAARHGHCMGKEEDIITEYWKNKCCPSFTCKGTILYYYNKQKFPITYYSKYEQASQPPPITYSNLKRSNSLALGEDWETSRCEEIGDETEMEEPPIKYRYYDDLYHDDDVESSDETSSYKQPQTRSKKRKSEYRSNDDFSNFWN